MKQLPLSFERPRAETLDLARFDISPTRGFLPATDPKTDLPSALADAAKFGKALPHFLSEALPRKHFRGLIEQELKLPNLGDLTVEDSETVRAIYRTYAFLASAYVHAIDEPEVARIPACLAVPLWLSAWRLGKKPILSYDGYALWNWKRKDPKGPIAFHNLENVQNFVTLSDEPGFILSHVEIEAEAAPAIVAVGQAQQAVLEENIPALDQVLLVIASALDRIADTLEALPDHCRPEVFFRDLRPYIMSFGDERRGRGIVFEGVKVLGEKPVFLNGEIGAQSSIMPSLVAALGICYTKTGMTDYLAAMECYMPVGHREFIRAVRRGPSIREFAKRIDVPTVTDAYNECLEAMHAFRRECLSFATEYLARRVGNLTASGGIPLEAVSTGTDETLFVKLFSLLAEEILEHRLPS
ncbi:MAG: hypothetical protein Q8Q41_03030 [bacterium]|nr:hypothetical protein [bacterium]